MGNFTALTTHKTVLRIVLAVLIALCYLLFHLHYLQQFLDWDQVVYANNIINSITHKTAPLINAHHIHLETGGKLFYELTRPVLGTDDIVFYQRLRSLLTASFGLFFLFLFLAELTGSTWIGLAGTLLVAFSTGYLEYATKVDTAIYPAAMAAVILWAVNRIDAGRRSAVPLAAVAGLAAAGGIIAHQYMAIPAAIAGLCVLFPRAQASGPPAFSPFSHEAPAARFKPEKPVRRIAAFSALALTGILCAGLTYFTVASERRMNFFPREGVPLKADYGSFQRWLYQYATMGAWGRGFERFNPKAPFTGFTDAFLMPDRRIYVSNFNFVFSYALRDFEASKNLPYNLLAVFTAFVLAGTVLLSPLLWRRYGRMFPATLFSFAAIALFAAYWEPHYVEFWVVPALYFCVLAVMLVNFLGEKVRRLLPPAGNLAPVALLLAFALLFFFHNTRTYLIPYSRVKHLEAINPDWEPSYYRKLWSDGIYRHPENVYQDVYGTRPGEIFPAAGREPKQNR